MDPTAASGPGSLRRATQGIPQQNRRVRPFRLIRTQSEPATMTKQRCDKESVARELIRQDRARQLRSLKKDLIAAANQPMTSLDMTEVDRKSTRLNSSHLVISYA